ncbi:hypothetical protein MKX08_010238 [Trichoderma sp. CBMAI-0020]|nr:hypothetical protein MKX08_010238 [Trichoderma sp. CBMAI-0020]
MYRILFPGDTRIPSPYKDVPSFNTDELRAWAAEIQRICNSSSSDVRTQIEHIVSVAQNAIRDVCTQSSRVQHDFQETTSEDVMAADYSGTMEMLTTYPPDLGPLMEEYRGLSADIIDGQLSGAPASIFGNQDDSASYVMDTDLMGIGEFPYYQS